MTQRNLLLWFTCHLRCWWGLVFFGWCAVARGLTQRVVCGQVVLKETNKIIVHDILSEMEEDLDFRDRVISMAVGFGYLVVTTSLQCCIYLLQVRCFATRAANDIKD